MKRNRHRPRRARAPLVQPDGRLAAAHVGADASARLSAEARPGRDVDAWFWGMPRDTIHKGGAAWDVDAAEFDPAKRRIPWPMLLDSLDGILTIAPRPLITEHERNGTGRGFVVDWRSLTQAEAAARGIRQASAEALYFGVRFTCDQTRAAYDSGALVWSSPRFLFDYTDEAGELWPWFLLELSLTSIPQQTRVAIPITELRGVQLSADTTDTDQTMEEQIAMMETRIARLEAMCEELRAGKMTTAEDDDAAPAAAMETEAADEEREEPPAAATIGGVGMSAASDVTERERALSAKLARLERERAIDAARADLAPYVVSEEQRAALESVALSAPAEFQTLLGALPRLDTTTSATIATPASGRAAGGVALTAAGLTPSTDGAFSNANEISAALEHDARALLAAGQCATMMQALDRAEAAWLASLS